MGGIISIIIGAVLVIGGLSGTLVFRGTNSGLLLALVGVVIAGRGVFRLMNTAPQSEPPNASN